LDRTDCEVGVDQLQLLLRNARQILKIVRATFTDVEFREKSSGDFNKTCVSGVDAGEQLARLWHDAGEKLPQGETTESEAYRALEALYKVSVGIAALAWEELIQ